MNAAEFVAKWRHVTLTERASAQSHFIDLCHLLGHQTPVEADPKGEWFTFERGLTKRSGKQGWADVWKKGFFAFEYKGKHKDLNAAYDQLLTYRNSLENPPLLVACDIERLVIHTNFTGTVEKVHEIRLDELTRPEKLDMLQWVFNDPKKLEPTVTREAITNRVAGQLGKIALGMRERGLHPRAVAKFLNRLVFCMFAEDFGLLPSDLFTRIIDASHNDPNKLADYLKQLFSAMASGGLFGLENIRYFNGNLFEDAAIILPTPGEMTSIKDAARLDWSQVDPSIFGTLFERGMDPDLRSQLGAHYTSFQDIETLVEPVVMTPLRREWTAVRSQVEQALGITSDPGQPASPPKKVAKKPKKTKNAEDLIRDFLQRLQSVTVLDPACGSGNFLYVCLQKLKDLEQEVLIYHEDRGFGKLLPFVGPRQLLGLEINPYAFDLAQMTVWIGYLQWQRSNGYRTFGEPILQRLDNFRCMDSILDLTDPENPKEPEWPEAEFIVGNPPFLGGKKMRESLGGQYIDELFKKWRTTVRPEADLCCYWFEKSRKQIELGNCKRAGLLATQGIRGGANQESLRRIKESGDIFFAISDRGWILDGASVHISIIGFDSGRESVKHLDGRLVGRINSDLSGTEADVTTSRRLADNLDLAFMGDTKGGSFDIRQAKALELLNSPNPHGRPNSDVIVPWINGLDITRRHRDFWIIDFGVNMSLEDASKYEAPFEYARELVYPERKGNSRAAYRDKWWIHVEARPALRDRIWHLPRYLCTARVAKFRLFVWAEPPTLPDSQVFAFASADDFLLGVLQSRSHEVWSLKRGTKLETRPRYTATTCFETFPFPEPTEAQRTAIGDAARDLDALRTRWLNPPEWTRQEILEFPGSIDGPWSRFVHDPDERGIGTVRYPVTKPGSSSIVKNLAERTLTNLYNKPPAWLESAHRKLDAAVFAAYGWEPTLTDDEILAHLLALNLERAQKAGPPLDSPEPEPAED